MNFGSSAVFVRDQRLDKRIERFALVPTCNPELMPTVSQQLMKWNFGGKHIGFFDIIAGTLFRIGCFSNPAQEGTGLVCFLFRQLKTDVKEIIDQ